MATKDRNSKAELIRDIEFLEDLASDLEHGRDGDKTRLDSLAGKLSDWKDELEELAK